MYLRQFKYHYKDPILTHLEDNQTEFSGYWYINSTGKYDFMFQNRSGENILYCDYTKEVEKHLTEINYLGI